MGKKRNNVTRFIPQTMNRKFVPNARQVEEGDILSNLSMPAPVPDLPDELKRKIAALDKDIRENTFDGIASAHYNSHTLNVIPILKDKIESLTTQLEAAEQHRAKLAKNVSDASSVQIAPKEKSEPDHDYTGFKAWMYEIFGNLKPHHQFKLALLGGTAIGVSTVGATSILKFLMEHSDVYASNPLLALPLLMVPVGAGVGLELILEKIRDAKLKDKLEGVVSITCVASVGVWLIGLLDMANGGGVFEESIRLLPRGLRTAAQIVFEMTAITLLSSAIFDTMRQTNPDEVCPSNAKRLHQEEHDVYNEHTVIPLTRDLEKAKAYLSTYEGHRDEFLRREKANFALICKQHDDLHDRK